MPRVPLVPDKPGDHGLRLSTPPPRRIASDTRSHPEPPKIAGDAHRTATRRGIGKAPRAQITERQHTHLAAYAPGRAHASVAAGYSWLLLLAMLAAFA